MTDPGGAVFECTRCGRPDRVALQRPPFPTDLGARVRSEICSDCWEEWKTRQMALINHHGLKLHEGPAREFLYAHLRAFLFGEGDAEDAIDSSRPGSVEW